MPNRDCRQTTALRAALLLASSATLMVPHALAGGKSRPAPIVYAGSQPETSARPEPARSQPRVSAPASSAVATGYSTPVRAGERIVTSPSRRIEFRYPDDPKATYASAARPATVTTASASARPVLSPPQAQPAPLSIPIDPLTATPAAASATIEMASLGPVDTRPRPAVEYSKPATVAPRFEPVAAANFKETGIASWYGPNFDGKPTASGEIFDQDAFTGAHPTLPLPSLVEVTNLETGKALVIRINDRGPFVDGRILDVSRAAARELGFEQPGMARVQLRYLGPASDEVQTASLDTGTMTDAAPAAAPQAAYVPPPATARPATPASYTPAPASPAGEMYFVQIGSFSDVGNAQVYAEGARTVGPVTIKQARVNGADYFRVMIGPVSGMSEAERLRGKLGAAGFSDSMIKRAD